MERTVSPVEAFGRNTVLELIESRRPDVVVKAIFAVMQEPSSGDILSTLTGNRILSQLLAPHAGILVV